MINLADILTRYRKRIVWGAGRKFVHEYDSMMPIDYIVDSNKAIWGQRVHGIEICAPSNLLMERKGETCVIICSRFEQEIIKSLKEMGINENVYTWEMIVSSSVNCSSKKSYAAFAEDAIIAGMSDRYSIPIKYYMDIGANHPIVGNATFSFYVKGAEGCLVEPNIEYKEILELCRPRDTIVTAGVASALNDGNDLVYYQIAGGSTRNTFSKELADEYMKAGYQVADTKLKMYSLNHLIDLYGKKVDYINIDVEGLEYEILKDFSFEDNDVSFFNIEKSDQRIIDIMKANDYEVAAETLSNWVFVKKGLVRE